MTAEPSSAKLDGPEREFDIEMFGSVKAQLNGELKNKTQGAKHTQHQTHINLGAVTNT